MKNEVDDFLVLYDRKNNHLVLADKYTKKYRNLKFEEMLNIEDYFEYNK